MLADDAYDNVLTFNQWFSSASLNQIRQFSNAASLVVRNMGGWVTWKSSGTGEGHRPGEAASEAEAGEAWSMGEFGGDRLDMSDGSRVVPAEVLLS